MSATTANELLGYPRDARLLIVNADDFGMCHASNAGTLDALLNGVVSSTTLMTPCPWAREAMRMLAEHPEIAFGVHLTLISEHCTYRWGPIASKSDVPSLLDEQGYFFPNDRRDEFPVQANIDEVETEFRAQIATVFDAGLKPSHLDWHCLYDGGREDIFALTERLAREFGLALRTHDHAHAAQCLAAGRPAIDQGVLDSYSLPSEGKSDTYARLLGELPPGLSEWAVHPSLGGPEGQAMEPEGWHVRRADYEFVTSALAREVIASEGITVLSYRDLQPLWATNGVA